VELLRDNLMEISSPFINQLTDKYHALTPTEIGICNMIRTGLRSKEIAQTRGVSTATVSRHRERIRRKLGLTNADVNLTTYLQTTMAAPPR
jgi:DNA-binding CsgD family transcriptional regulator